MNREQLRARASDLAAFVDALRDLGINVRLSHIELSDGAEFGKRQPFEGVSLESYEAALFYGSKRK